MPIFPCPDWQKYGDVQRTDGYVCSCVDGRWSCDDCWMGASLCSEAPDGALLFPPPLADDASHGVETGAGVEVGADAALEDAARTDSSASASPDGQTPVACQRLEGDAAMVSFAFTGNEAEAGPNDAIIQWFNDAGMGESCGPSSCDARCPPGHACSLAFITHALVLSGGTCL
jgi:hypothetical protein